MVELLAGVRGFHMEQGAWWPTCADKDSMIWRKGYGFVRILVDGSTAAELHVADRESRILAYTSRPSPARDGDPLLTLGVSRPRQQREDAILARVLASR